MEIWTFQTLNVHYIAYFSLWFIILFMRGLVSHVRPLAWTASEERCSTRIGLYWFPCLQCTPIPNQCIPMTFEVIFTARTLRPATFATQMFFFFSPSLWTWADNLTSKQTINKKQKTILKREKLKESNHKNHKNIYISLPKRGVRSHPTHPPPPPPFGQACILMLSKPVLLILTIVQLLYNFYYFIFMSWVYKVSRYALQEFLR